MNTRCVRGAAGIMLALLALAAVACGTEKVSTVDEARAAIRKILEGADPGDFKAADDAPALVHAILGDASDVGKLENALSPSRIGTHAGAACDAAGLVAELGEKGDAGISVSSALRAHIRQRVAEYRLLPNPTQVGLAVNPVLDAAVGLTESTMVQVTTDMCSSIQHL